MISNGKLTTIYQVPLNYHPCMSMPGCRVEFRVHHGQIKLEGKSTKSTTAWWMMLSISAEPQVPSAQASSGYSTSLMLTYSPPVGRSCSGMEPLAPLEWRQKANQ